LSCGELTQAVGRLNATPSLSSRGFSTARRIWKVDDIAFGVLRSANWLLAGFKNRKTKEIQNCRFTAGVALFQTMQRKKVEPKKRDQDRERNWGSTRCELDFLRWDITVICDIKHQKVSKQYSPGLWNRKSHHPTPGNFDYPTPAFSYISYLKKVIIFFR